MKIKGNNKRTRVLKLKCLSADLNFERHHEPRMQKIGGYSFIVEDENDEGIAIISFEDTYEIEDLINTLNRLRQECKYGCFGTFVEMREEK